MYIKQVIIEGFKSYKDITTSEPFSPKINAVVGANGSGKSNFFHAIRFVLNDIFTTLRAEDRQRLLHEGAGHAVMSAYVEIVFDNSDNRLPVDREAVRLRRTIGLKKDEYYLDKKHITKTEVMNLLESAGFSRANPYYVVQQGKIMKMSTMKDHERLELLKEIGGTKVYEERRKESLKLMQETAGRRHRIDEVVGQLNTRLAELDEERQELAQYQQLNRQRRSLEYTLYDKELSDTKLKLEQLEAERVREGEKASSAREELRGAHQKLKRLDKELRGLLAQQAELQAQHAAATAQKDEAVARRVRLELDVAELQQRISSDGETREHCQAELEQLTSEISGKEGELAGVRQELEQHEAQEVQLARDIADRNRRLQALYQKQGRSGQFASESERDEWIDKEVEQLQETVRKKKDVIEGGKQQVAQLSEELMELSQAIGDKESNIRDQEESVSRADRDHKDMTAKRDELTNERKELWRREAELEETEKTLRDDIKRAEGRMQRSVAGDINRGLNSVKRICREHNIQGVHGPLVELFDCIPQMHTAIEVTAGNSLFHVVVEDDDVATRIVGYLTKEKAGRATFMPLNRLQPPSIHYPNAYGSDVLPMMKKLKFNDKFKPAIQQIFGKTLLCKDLDLATTVAHATDLNCITMDGDQVSKKGTLTGGYHDENRSKLDAMKAIKDLGRKMGETVGELRKLKAVIAEKEQAISQLLGELQKQDVKRSHLRNGVQPLRAELRSLQQRESAARQQLESKEKQMVELQDSIGALQQQVAGLEGEKGTALLAQLTGAERKELQRLNPDVERLNAELVACRTRRMEVESRAVELGAVLTTNLGQRRRQLEDQLAQADLQADRAALELRRGEQASTAQAIEEVAQTERSIADKLDAASKRVSELKLQQEELKQAEDSDEQHVQDEAKLMEQLSSRRSAAQAKRADLEKKIRELGSLPADAYEKYREKSLGELHKLLKKSNSQLKKYSHVNKKAVDQYLKFTEQREDLVRRQGENARADEKIKQLIETLDLRKDEAIERTFKGVAKNFKEIFAELAPGGRGELVMQKRLRREDDDAEEADEDELAAARDRAAEKYSGVKVKVSFGQGDVVSLKSLSGGQKTLVALALIFAIQRCDPAPFYLFDEIDAALDPQYRTTVARMLKQQASDVRNPSQFIVTTFHPQILLESDVIYGVSHSNRISRIDVVTKEDALEFIQTAEKEGAEGHGEDSER